MADWIHKTTLQYLVSLGEPALPEAAANYVRNPLPNRATILGIEQKYRKLSGSTVSEMTVGEKAAVDAVLEAAATLADKARAKLENQERHLSGLALTILDELNILRAEHSLAARTVAQLKTAIDNKIDSL